MKFFLFILKKYIARGEVALKIIQKNELCDFFHIDEKITIVDNIKFKY